MRATIALTILLSLAAGALAVTLDDPYVWLEDTHGEKQLAWVKEHNQAALSTLIGDINRQVGEYGSLAKVPAAGSGPRLGSL